MKQRKEHVLLFVHTFYVEQRRKAIYGVPFVFLIFESPIKYTDKCIFMLLVLYATAAASVVVRSLQGCEQERRTKSNFRNSVWCEWHY